MKALIIAVVVIVAGIQLGSKAFDFAMASAQQSDVAQAIEDRQAAAL
jgi:hypothetical protein